jgi:hypothetical protein
MSLAKRVAKKILADPEMFSRHILRMPLRNYQLRAMRPVLKSILNGDGDEFLWEFSRQSGKNETLAHLEVYLANLFQRVGGSIVHTAPTGVQLASDHMRLSDRMDNPWNQGKIRGLPKVMAIVYHVFRIIFLSGHISSNVVGWTASVLLVYNEHQSFNLLKQQREFDPMAASTNATRLYIGTPRTSHTAFAQKKRELKALEIKDGKQRVFTINWREVAAELPAYKKFVTGEIAKKGEQHPTILTEFECIEMDAGGLFFDQRRRALMLGEHRRRPGPEPGKLYVATIDVAGEDEGDPLALDNPNRDYTIGIIWEVDTSREHVLGGPIYKAVDFFVDRGSKHFDVEAGADALNRRLYQWLKVWRVAHICGDGTGIGAGLMSWLSSRFGEFMVTSFQFSRTSKALLGSNFISLIETGRFKMYADLDEHTSDTPAGAGFWTQVRACAYELHEELPFEKGLRWFVPDSARYETSDPVTGNATTQLIHDDKLMAGGLIAEIDRQYRESEIIFGSPDVHVLPGLSPEGDEFDW